MPEKFHDISLAILCAPTCHIPPYNRPCSLANSFTCAMPSGCVQSYSSHCSTSVRVIAVTLARSLASSTVATLPTLCDTDFLHSRMIVRSVQGLVGAFPFLESINHLML